MHCCGKEGGLPFSTNVSVPRAADYSRHQLLFCCFIIFFPGNPVEPRRQANNNARTPVMCSPLFFFSPPLQRLRCPTATPPAPPPLPLLWVIKISSRCKWFISKKAVNSPGRWPGGGPRNKDAWGLSELRRRAWNEMSKAEWHQCNLPFPLKRERRQCKAVKEGGN